MRLFFALLAFSAMTSVIVAKETVHKTKKKHEEEKPVESRKKKEKQFTGSPRVNEELISREVKDIQYMGENNRFETVFILTTDRKLLRSENEGRSWTEETSKLDGVEEIQPNGRGRGVYSNHPSPADPNKLVIVGVGHNHWATEDGGVTYRRLNTTADIREIQFHPFHHDWFLFSEKTPKCYDDTLNLPPCSLVVYATPDFGKNVWKIAENVVQFGWGTKSMKPSTVLMTMYEPRNKPKDGMKFDIWDPLVDLVITEDFMSTHKVLARHGNSFSIEGDFLFVAVVVPENNENVVKLTVSSDGGETFSPVRVPLELKQFGYTIVDASHGTAFLHVNHGTYKSPYGTLYISDATGANYSLSLEEHARSEDGRTDFARVEAHEGIYLANKLLNYREISDALETEEERLKGAGNHDGAEADETTVTPARQLETFITFNKGVDWSPIRAPSHYHDGTKIECENPVDGLCRLHLNGITNRGGYGPFYSTKTAAGLIIATGNAGDYLDSRNDAMSAWISRDAGLTWSHVARGSFIYEIGDHGSVVVMATNDRPTDQVLYSVDEGATWHAHQFRKSPIYITNIVNNPTSTSTSFIMYGRTSTQEGVLVHLDFEGLKLRMCEGAEAAGSSDSDYEKWTPGSYAESTCLMGRTVSYVRRKQDKICWNGAEFERASIPVPCECTAADYECDYGYARSDKAGNPCEVVDPSAVHTAVKPAICPAGRFYEESFGYRLIGGDSCVGGLDRRPKLHPCDSLLFHSVSHRALILLIVLSLFSLTLGLFTIYTRVDSFRLFVDETLSRLPWSVKQWKYEGLGSNRAAPDSLLDDDEFDDLDATVDDMDKVLHGGSVSSSSTTNNNNSNSNTLGGGGGMYANLNSNSNSSNNNNNSTGEVQANGYSRVATTDDLIGEEEDEFNPRS